MIQKDDVSEEDLSFIFSHGQPLVFHACPNRLVPKLIEAFQQLNEEPPFLHATTMHGNVGSIEVSPPLYVDCFPCTACRRDATVQTRLRTCDAKSECVVETFHIRSNLFTKQLSIELYYMTAGHFNGCEFYARPETASDTAKLWSPIKVIVLVEDPVCGMAVVPSAKVTSKRSTMMLVPEFAVEVYGFLDRIHVGSSLLANRRMHDSLSAAKGILPLHQLSCDLDRENLGCDYDIGRERYGTHYQLILHQFQRDLPYNDARQFELCDEMTPQEGCALALRYLSNSYIVGFGDRRCSGSHHAKFFLRMLGALAGRNISVGRVEMDHFEACVRDYRALERAFGGQLPITELRLSLDESRFVGLVKITDFFRYSGVQRLKELCLLLYDQWNESPPRMGLTPNPLWIDGITRLGNCERYEVHYTSRRIPSAVRSRIVQICEKFERDEISETVKHFALHACSDVEVAFPLNSDNLVASRVNVTAENRRAYAARYEWDVYRFRNVVTSKSLTALVGHGRGEGHGTVLHLLRGEVGPEALLTFRPSC